MPDGKEKNFIDFILDASTNRGLRDAFISKIGPPTSSVKDLIKFFEAEGYKVSEEDCKKLIETKINITTDIDKCY